MAMRNIVKLGDPTLKKHSRTVEKFDDRLAQLIDDMKETMYANDGCGLAAVQVGILKRVVVLDVGDGCIGAGQAAAQARRHPRHVEPLCRYHGAGLGDRRENGS